MGVLIQGTIQHSKGPLANLAALLPVDAAVAVVETAGNNVELRVGDDSTGTTVWRDPVATLKADVQALQSAMGLVNGKLATDDTGKDTLQEVLDFIELVQTQITNGTAVVPWSNVSGKPATFPATAHDHNALYLGIAAKAADADKLDGFDSSATAVANTIPVRDASGSVAGNITGNAATATKLATPRSIALTGAVTGSVSFDGSGNASIATTHAIDGIKAPAF